MWVHGHAIVCTLARMTDAAGVMPEALRFEADWALFQAALDRADVALIGHRTHAAAPNVKRRRRLVVTRHPDRPLDDPCAEAIRPDDDIRGRLAQRFGDDVHVAVVGGTAVFDLAGAVLGYDAFDLTIAPAVELPGGRAVFTGSDDLDALARRLERLGLRLGEAGPLAAEPRLRLERWRRAVD